MKEKIWLATVDVTFIFLFVLCLEYNPDLVCHYKLKLGRYLWSEDTKEINNVNFVLKNVFYNVFFPASKLT